MTRLPEVVSRSPHQVQREPEDHNPDPGVLSFACGAASGLMPVLEFVGRAPAKR